VQPHMRSQERLRYPALAVPRCGVSFAYCPIHYPFSRAGLLPTSERYCPDALLRVITHSRIT
jgi:hypothetical protein